jgi:hypothetical protein
MQCRAKSKRSQQRCRRHATPGAAVCRMHGGKTPRGSASIHFRTGRHSKFVPARLAAKYRDAAQDPELLSLRGELALLDARMAELLGRVDTGEGGAPWDTLQKEWATFRLHRSRGDVPKMHTSMAKLDLLMDRKLTDSAAWAEISAAIEQRRKLVESEQKRMILLQQMLSQEEAMTLMGVLVDIVAKRVADQPTLAQIVADLQALLEADGPPRGRGLRVVT